jgi:uncharacterized protein (TIGR00369 family)
MIWKRRLTLDELNATSVRTLVGHLGIVYTRLGDDVLEAEMPVDARTYQPFGLLHGGASAALAETLGSMAGYMMTVDGQCVVGTELNATHHRRCRRVKCVPSASRCIWAVKIKAGRLWCLTSRDGAAAPAV